MKWTTLTTYIDLETGEVLEYWNQLKLENEYNIIKQIEKKTKIINNGTRKAKGTIYRTYGVRKRTKQGELFTRNKRTNR